MLNVDQYWLWLVIVTHYNAGSIPVIQPKFLFSLNGMVNMTTLHNAKSVWFDWDKDDDVDVVINDLKPFKRNVKPKRREAIFARDNHSCLKMRN